MVDDIENTNTSLATLWVYEETKKYMGFDPEVQLQLPFVGPLEGPWNLLDEYPRTVQGYIAELRNALGMETGAYQLLSHQIDFIHKHPERSEHDGDQPSQQASPTEGHAEPQTGGGDPEDDPERPGEVGEDRESGDDQGGQAEPVSGG